MNESGALVRPGPLLRQGAVTHYPHESGALVLPGLVRQGAVSHYLNESRALVRPGLVRQGAIRL